ncbi:glycosyltransferase [Acholeplasma sp. OttesenSCG-928-E16]|nr:glycosyltransferase [Acholeplasma sp. OttesenSCG-928-E16]
MVIVFVVDNFTSKTDGTNISAQRFKRELTKLGHEVRVIAIGESGDGLYGLKERYIPIVTPVSRLNNMRFAKFDKKVVEQALEGADIVHFFFPWSQKRIYKMAKKKGICITAAFHCHPANITYNIGLRKWNFLNTILFRMFRSWLYKKVDNIHCPSKFIADELEKNKYKARLHVISNGVADYFQPAEKQVERKNDMINILMIGRYAAEKRQDLLIKAVSMSKYKDKIQLIFAGAGPKEKFLKRLSDKLPVKPLFEFVPQEKLIELLHKTDLYVHAADIEIEGISCMEAISTGVVPIISNSKKSATPKFALTNKSLFKAGDAKDLKDKIEYLIENEEERIQLSKAYAIEGKYYSIKHTILLAEHFFKEALIDQRTEKIISQDKDLQRFIKSSKPKRTLGTLLANMFYYLIAIPILYIINKIYFGLKIEGRENIKKAKKNGAITICNHIHHLDSVVCAIGLFPKKPIFTAQPSNFEISFVGLLVKVLGGTPTPTTINQTKAFFYALSRSARSRKIIHFFPEGERNQYKQELGKFKRGAFHLAVDSKKPIIPMRINYREPAGVYKLFKKKTPCFTLIIGEPIYHNFLLEKPKAIEELQKKSENEMEKLLIENIKISE